MKQFDIDSLPGETIFKIEHYLCDYDIRIEFVSGRKITIRAERDDTCYCVDHCYCNPTPTIVVEENTNNP
jgi:hypothetical protein